jgi:hypothetical protein
MSESYLAALGRALAFCADAGDVSIEGLIERALLACMYSQATRWE